MTIREHLSRQRILLSRARSWGLPVSLAALCTGSLTALFLHVLEIVTIYRWEHPWLLFALPFIGIAIWLMYRLEDGSVSKGNNLILEEIHLPAAGIPFRMAPKVILATWLTHLGGGSAGREGTAVQIGGSLAGWLGRRTGNPVTDAPLLLCCGMAAGFGAVFGTPLAGAVFALEVLAIGRRDFTNILPCLYAAVLGDAVCSAWGIRHTQYILYSMPPADIPGWAGVLLRIVPAGIAFGIAAALFVRLTHWLKAGFARAVGQEWLRPVAGAALLILLATLFGGDYLGLGVSASGGQGVSIVGAFAPGGAAPESWFLKLLFTAITLAAGFKGGEVTPLFFIGAALGNVLGYALGLPADLLAGLGLIAVLAGGANTPLACVVLGAELFGPGWIPAYLIACCLAYECSGNSGIYPSQKRFGPKRLSRLTCRMKWR